MHTMLRTEKSQAHRRTMSCTLLLFGLMFPITAALGAEPAQTAVETSAGQKRVQMAPASPFYPRSGDRHVLLIGASDREALTLWRNEKGFNWRSYLDELAAHGFNYVRQNVTAWTGLSAFRGYPAQFSQPRWAFTRTGPGAAVDGEPRFDLTRFDEGYFRERLGPFLQEAERRGIVVELTLFDDCRSRRAFADSLYAEPNHVNTFGLKPGDDPHADTTLGDPPLLSVQERYVFRVLEATREFGNVIYEVANETGGARWVAHFIEFIHQQHPGALVSAGEQSSPYDPVTGGCDLVVKHRGAGGLYRTDEDIARHRQSLILLRRGGKPVLHNEFFLFANRSTDDPNFVRKMFWADFTGGGHANFYDFTWWRGTGRTKKEGSPSQSPPPEVLNAGKFLRRFVEEGEVPFERMAPHDELATTSARDGVRPFVFAQPGVVYVVYLIQGSTITLNLNQTNGTLSARWFNPREGKFGEEFKVQGGGQREFKAPDNNDWALCLLKRRWINMIKTALMGLASGTVCLALSLAWAGGTLRQPPSHAKSGALSVHPTNPSYFQSADGKPVVLIGDYTWGTFSDVDYDYKAMLDTLKANGLNFARVWVWWGCGEFAEENRVHVEPYLRTGPGNANDGKPKYDLTKFNPAFFDRLRAVCAAARERGIFLQLTLFDAWMIKHRHLWRLHAYHRDNNINGVDGDPKNTGTGTDGRQGFCSLGNPKALEAQKAFIRKVVDAVNEFDNVYFEIANENYYNADWERRLCEFTHEYERSKPKQPLVMPLDLPNHDYGGIKTWDLQRLHASLLKARVLKQPLIFDTDGIGSPDDATVRKAAWTAFVSGGHVDYLDDSLQIGSEYNGDFKGTRRVSLRQQLGYLASFTKQVRFWEMQPDDAFIVGNERRAVPAFALASASEVVVYLPNGGSATLDLSSMKGTLSARWFNPREGSFGKRFKVEGEGQREFQAPEQNDWALLLRRRE